MPLALVSFVPSPRTRIRALILPLLLALQLVVPSLASAGRVTRAKVKSGAVPAKRQAATRPATKTTKLRFGAATKKSQDSLKPQAKAKPLVAPTPAARTTKQAASRAKVGPARSTKKASRWKKSADAVKAGFAKAKASPGVTRVLKFYNRVAAKMVRKLDSWQARAPPWLAKSMNGLRTYTLPSIAAYTFSRVANDKVFLGTFLVANSITSNIILPGSIALGMDPVLATVLNILTTPLTMGVIVARERYTRMQAGESITLNEAAKVVGAEYRDFARARRVESSRAAKIAVPATVN